MGEFGSIFEFFEALNEAGVKYLVLRNYENLLEQEMFLDGHGDIDLLCDDYKKIVKAVGAIPFHVNPAKPDGDGIHYKIFVGGNPVSLDLRQIGDGYYCEKWERDLLNRRIRHECFYVMNMQDYFYTLVYHAILQKRSFSLEYKFRLTTMADTLGVVINGYSEYDFLRELERFMNCNGYQFTYSDDFLVPNRFYLVDANMIDHDRKLEFKHRFFDIKVCVIDFLVKVKHVLLR